MAKEPDNVALRRLREIRATLEDHSSALLRIEKQRSDLTKLVTFSLGQSTETQFRQTQQDRRIDELLERVGKLESERTE